MYVQCLQRGGFTLSENAYRIRGLVANAGIPAPMGTLQVVLGTNGRNLRANILFAPVRGWNRLAPPQGRRPRLAS